MNIASPAPPLDAFPRKRCSVGALVHDAGGRILILKPSFRPEWLLPGGVVEEGEAPADALARELLEEVGLVPAILGLACVDYVPACSRYPEAMHFLFQCQRLDEASVLAVRPNGSEIVEVVLAEPSRCAALLAPTIARRLAALDARQSGYLEAGRHLYAFQDGFSN